LIPKYVISTSKMTSVMFNNNGEIYMIKNIRQCLKTNLDTLLFCSNLLCLKLLHTYRFLNLDQVYFRFQYWWLISFWVCNFTFNFLFTLLFYNIAEIFHLQIVCRSINYILVKNNLGSESISNYNSSWNKIVILVLCFVKSWN
jgi:hypothetical protein